jgi:hypothetical protein
MGLDFSWSRGGPRSNRNSASMSRGRSRRVAPSIGPSDVSGGWAFDGAEWKQHGGQLRNHPICAPQRPYGLIRDFHPAFISNAIEQLRPIVEGLFSKAEAGAQRAAPLDAKSPDAFQFLAVWNRLASLFG